MPRYRRGTWMRNVLPLPDGAVHRDAAAVRLGDVLDDGQTQARAAQIAAAGLVDAVEPLEEPRQVLARYAAARGR